jgi:hypothetical protein
MAHRAMGMELVAVPAGDARGLLAAVLERVEAQRHERGCALRIGNAENAALFAQLVVIERVRGKHQPSRGWELSRAI